ncbi:MAG: SPFH domain-containing protein [Defluviitaleaceae bacterium]|nr:SPFH domain-containing protein [Defluviitaleaceae bacterium]
MNENTKIRQNQYEEIALNPKSGMVVLIINSALILGAIGLIVFAAMQMASYGSSGLWVAAIIAAGIYTIILGPIIYAGLKIVKPNEALVLALFGKYIGTIKKEGFFFVNPFAVAVNPAKGTSTQTLEQPAAAAVSAITGQPVNLTRDNRKISLKTITLSNNQQKINDALGNPIIIGIVVIWRVVNTAKAVFNVDNYKEFLSIQCDSALRNIVRLYPYDAVGDGDESEKTLRGSGQEIANMLKEEIQSKTDVAGLEIMEARITHLAYAPEIAAAMLQRQQAKATVDAKALLVEGAVGMVELALDRLSENNVVHLDEERKAAMVSNLLVVLCGSREAQPVVNSGSLY